MIQCSDVWYEYPADPDDEENEGQARGAQAAVRGLNLTVEQGEFLCILGHNGSGKSTAAKMLNALFLPTRGTVKVLGMDTANEADTLNIRKNVGLVLQNPDDQIVTTIVEEDVAFGLENIGVEPIEIRKRVDGALAAVGLSEHARSTPHTLSGGQKQRVAIAGIIAMEPRLMVMDEPTAMLDPQGRKEVLDTMMRLRKDKGLTLVLITHFIQEALLADRVVVMEKGRITLQGTPRQVLSQVAQLRDAGLEPPPALHLADQLRRDGIPVPQDVMLPEELVEALCKLKQIS